ncbi:MAG: restriction endonuclease subunit M, partial [Chloroflexi bacterium UTCFX4]
DAVIGNPPYIRIQALKEWAPLEVEIYKEKYAAARAGNYDIYIVFVEKGLGLLNERGRLGFILPHKFFNSKYGEPLRRLLANGKQLAHVVHFGDQQIFDGATTYTTLLFLDKRGNETFDFVRVTNLDSWRAGEPQTRGEIAAANVSAAEWNFSVGENAALFERLAKMPTKLGDVADRIFQGLVTGADPVFILTKLENGKYYSEALEQEIIVEHSLMHALCKGSVNIRRYFVDEITKSILFPYKLVEGKAELLSTKELKEQFPFAWEYLRQNRSLLEARENGKWKHEKWYAFGRSQNLSEMEQTKIMTPSIANRASFTLDDGQHYYFVGSGGGGGGGYGVTIKADVRIAYAYLLGLLNSRLLDKFLKSISSPFSHGYYAYNRQYIEQLPIRAIDFTNAADVARHDRMVTLVERMLLLHQQRAAAQTETDQQIFQRQIDATDKLIDALVYELYELTDEEIRIIESATK